MEVVSVKVYLKLSDLCKLYIYRVVRKEPLNNDLVIQASFQMVVICVKMLTRMKA